MSEFSIVMKIYEFLSLEKALVIQESSYKCLNWQKPSSQKGTGVRIWRFESADSLCKGDEGILTTFLQDGYGYDNSVKKDAEKDHDSVRRTIFLVHGIKSIF